MPSDKKLKVAFVVPYAEGYAPGQRFRFEHYLPLLDNVNIQHKIYPFISITDYQNLYGDIRLIQKIWIVIKGNLKRLGLIFILIQYDYIFLFREATPLGPPWFEFLTVKVLKRRIIYDFDDAIWLEDPDEKGSLLAKLKWKKKIASICSWSYRISTGNQFLQQYAEKYNRNVSIIPTVVDVENYHNPKLYKKQSNNLLVIGWTGSHSTLYYLNQLIPVLKDLYTEKKFILRVIANRAPEFSFENMEFIEWSKENEVECLGQIDIGIMPLLDDLWSWGKCGFKLIQYMALEIPAVASDVGVNNKIIDHKETGFLCQNTGDWKKYLSELMENEDLRIKTGKRAREKIIKNYSVQATSEAFLQLFH